MQLHNSFQNIITIVMTLNIISTLQFILRSQLVEFKYNPVMLLKLKIVNKCKLGSTTKMHTVKLPINALSVYNNNMWIYKAHSVSKHVESEANNRQIPPTFSGVPACESSSSKSWVELSWVKSWIEIAISTFVTNNPGNCIIVALYEY